AGVGAAGVGSPGRSCSLKKFRTSPYTIYVERYTLLVVQKGARHDPHPPRQPRPPEPPRPRELAILRLERRHPPRLPRLHRLLRRRLEPRRTRMAALLRRTPGRGRAPRRLGLP